MEEMKKTSLSYCWECQYCYEPLTSYSGCEYFLIEKKRRGCPVGQCDKFKKRKENESKRRKISYGGGKAFN